MPVLDVEAAWQGGRGANALEAHLWWPPIFTGYSIPSKNCLQAFEPTVLFVNGCH